MTGVATTRDWEAEFKELNERERVAFRKLGAALYKVSARTPAAVIDEMEQAYADWQAAKHAVAEFVVDFRAHRAKPDHG